MTFIGPSARIIARYLTGMLITYGFMTMGEAETLMPDLVILISAIIGGAVEYAYSQAKKNGGPT